jgi:hypothetical protein
LTRPTSLEMFINPLRTTYLKLRLVVVIAVIDTYPNVN